MTPKQKVESKPKQKEAKPLHEKVSKVIQPKPEEDDKMEVDAEEPNPEVKIEKKSIVKETKPAKVEKKSDNEPQVASKPGKRPNESKPVPAAEPKRIKVEKGEVLVGGDKRKVRHIEWQYGRH
jgi:hypothetical protein